MGYRCSLMRDSEKKSSPEKIEVTFNSLGALLQKE